MNDKNQEYNSNNVLSVLVGLLIGGVAGATVMFLFAPQSGQKTRKMIQEKSIELVDQTTEMFEDAMSQVRSDGKKFAKDGRKMAKELLHNGQEMVVEQFEHVSDAAKAGRKALLSS